MVALDQLPGDARSVSASAKSNWRAAVDALSVSEDSFCQIGFFCRFTAGSPAGSCTGQSSISPKTCFVAIPRKLAENDASIQTLWDLLTALRQAERGVSVFPLSVPARDWWSPSPHTELPDEMGGSSPPRTGSRHGSKGIDQANEVAFLVAAKRPTTAGRRTRFISRSELSREQIGRDPLRGSGGTTCTKGHLWSSGYYGDRNG